MSKIGKEIAGTSFICGCLASDADSDEPCQHDIQEAFRLNKFDQATIDIARDNLNLRFGDAGFSDAMLAQACYEILVAEENAEARAKEFER